MTDELGIDPVRMVIGALNGMQFEAMEFDQYTQAAELIYTYKGKKTMYFINAAYIDSSWGSLAPLIYKDTYVDKN